MPAEYEFPRLSNVELIARFGTDEAALRRYRMLVALIRDGRPPNEVARTFGVSRESLRRLQHAFREGGLAALQSRKRGGGHFARSSPLVHAIKQELGEDPGVPAIVLWRRVQARLRDQGIEAPRSTFYRLLAQLRSEEHSQTVGSIPVGQLREALGGLLENPPLMLGRSELALLLLPDEREPLLRGRRLQEALHAAIERLRPSEPGPMLDDPRWRHYLIIAGEYEADEDRSSLQSALALSASTYSRAKREALERLVSLLPVVLDELPPPVPPASLIAPPPPPEHFELEAELDQYMQRLRQRGLVLIWGPIGSGKLDLAATLADRLRARGQNVIWHTCRPPDVDPNAGLRLLQTIAAALARDGRRDLWDALAGTDTIGANRRMELLRSGLASWHWTIIIVNAHWLVGDIAKRIVSTLRQAQEQRDIRLVWVSLSLPDWAHQDEWPSLPILGGGAPRHISSTQRAEQATAQISAHNPDPGSLPQRVAELMAVLPSISESTRLSTEQLASLLDALQPLEAILAALRMAQANR